jgi:hypothetical protein
MSSTEVSERNGNQRSQRQLRITASEEFAVEIGDSNRRSFRNIDSAHDPTPAPVGLGESASHICIAFPKESLVYTWADVLLALSVCYYVRSMPRSQPILAAWILSRARI